MNGICLCIDRLHAGFVGACGSTWVQTPAIDRLAADGSVFDQFHVDSLNVESLYRSYWFGQHAFCQQERSPAADRSLAALAARDGVHTVLATDDPAVIRLPGADEFQERGVLPEPRVAESVSSVESTHLARGFARLIQKVESLDRPFFLWCHLSSLGRVWDAPWEMRSQYAEADDPDPPTGAEVPCRAMQDGEDPDLLLGVSQAYAGQISLLDLCLGALCDALAESHLESETALALMGMRGMAFGEHGRIGPADGELHGEFVHVPLIVRLPEPETASIRSQALVQPADLCSTWRELLTGEGVTSTLAAANLLPLIREEAPGRDRIGLLGLQGSRAIRTPAWYLTTGPSRKLFAKPDDRWEVNDVADRHADVAENLAAVLSDYESRLASPDSGSPEPLSDVLLHGLE